MRKFLIILLIGSTLWSYNRKNWKHWSSTKGSCRKTRDAVLANRHIDNDPLHPLLFKSRKSCRVLSGKWKSYFTGKIIYSPKKIDIDHTVPLGYAANHGGSTWSSFVKKIYANYLGYRYHLTITESSMNRRKGKKGPNKYLPPKFRCRYIYHFQTIVLDWGLKLSKSEAVGFYRLKRKYCYSINFK